VTEHPLVRVVNDRFGGVLSHGSHDPDGLACINEAANVARGNDWGDLPDKAGLPDSRSLNDGPWSSNRARTDAMLPLGVALWDWSDWTPKRRTAWAQRVSERTIREILPIALRAAGLTAEAERCEREGAGWAAGAAVPPPWAPPPWALSLSPQAAAKSSVAWAQAWARQVTFASWARTSKSAREMQVAYTSSAAKSAMQAALAVQESADDVLRLACRIWIEEAKP
jgi:hypothetical protein